METKANAAIELAGARSVSFSDKGHSFTYVFRRIEDADWRRFFSGIVVESERVGKQRVDRIDHRTASLALIESCLVSVSGYAAPNGGEVMQLQNWKTRLPYGHRVRAAELLQDARASESSSSFVIEPDTDTVSLSAKWGGADGMLQFDGLVHRFTPPSGEDQRRFNRAASEARVVGGGRNGRTIYPGRQQLLLNLYDQLIVSVEGYTVSGEPLGSDVSKIRTWMDSLHKVAAAQELFGAPDADAESEG